MKLFGFKADKADERKKQLIEMMSGAAGADIVLPMQDRVIIADLVMSGLEKMFQTIEMHMNLCENVAPSGPGMEALFIMLMQEGQQALQGIVEQRAQHHAEHLLGSLCGPHRAELDQMTEELKAMGFNVLSGDELMAKLQEMGVGKT